MNQKLLKNRTLPIIMAIAMIISLIPCFSFADTYTNQVNGDSEITVAGTYNIADGATGVITISTTDAVTLVGHNISMAADGTVTKGTPYTDLTIDCVAGANLTLKNAYIVNNQGIDSTKPNPVVAGSHIINFVSGTAANTLTISGVNLLETAKYVASAGIHVPTGCALTINGTGTLYMYKYSQGSGIGGSAGEGNGTINIAMNDDNYEGYMFIKGSKTGALIGNDTGAVSASAAGNIGDITISGGNINLVNKAQGAAIGGSRMSCAGDVYLTGGNVAITTDFSGSAIGAGASKKSTSGANGNLYVTGGSLKTMITANAASSWGVTVPANSEYIVSSASITANTYGAKTASPVNVYLTIVDASQLINADYTYNVTVDGNAFCHGYMDYYKYSENSSSTVDNWSYIDDCNLYLFLPAGNHVIAGNNTSVNV